MFNLMLLIMFLISFMILLMPFFDKNINPLLMGLILLMFTILNTLNMSFYSINTWFMFLFYLIIVGGLLILFLYFNSFIMNMKILIKWNLIIMLMLKFFLLFLFLINILKLLNYYLFINLFNEIDSFYMNLLFNNNFNLNLLQLYFFYSNPNDLIILFMLFYLFFLLTTIVKMILSKKKTIRKLNY